MSRNLALLLAGMIVFSACQNSLKSKEKVQQAIVDRLKTHSGLDLSSLDITVTSVSFDKNMAYATVAFHPKANPAVNDAMVMNYTLVNRDGKWVVMKVGDSQGQGMTGHPVGSSGQQLPPGHPSIGGAGRQLPPGHPSLNPSNQPQPVAPANGQGADGRKQ